ncbi:COP9 signalosome complex subunit 8 [Aspergillus heteromorphus CBS 117.55]|uniref:COP9 signalosome complex subunit 8 n=1 Tax=Aspergillus heteromorphus CBS 117.55 TaxID=1448321 RepID=A0A317WW12_9EURO|nr:COP9 signalosome complex subunit 8 [Aspergillus heteromorphus CBS 117.55]PWY89357.1 COP9 signalosome complex subunit 8 [Aspergillus heteromorphus CBS 117.55]
MDLPPLSQQQLAAIVTSASTPAELYRTLSDYEAEACLLSSQDSNQAELLSLYYSTFFFSHLLTDQIYEARISTKRMPQGLLQHDPSLQNCLNLLRAVWQRKYEQVYQVLRELPWSDPLKPIVQSYEAYFQEKTLKEISKAYEAIRPAAAATYLGLDPVTAAQADSTTVQKLTAYGWTWDQETGLLHPKPVVEDPQKDDRLYNELSEVMALIGNRRS